MRNPPTSLSTYFISFSLSHLYKPLYSLYFFITTTQAHDLKTPLVSFCGDVDLLKMFFNALSRCAVREASAKLCVNGGEEFAIKPREIFRSLWSTSHFMLAAINRGQDYMKATVGHNILT